MSDIPLFKELAINSVDNRKHVVEVKYIGNYILKAIEKSSELYHSVYSYDESIKDHFTRRDTATTFTGYMELPLLIFDIDRKKNTDEYVLDKAREMVNNLYNDWQLKTENIEIWYSGTGYHIVVNNYFGVTLNPKEIKYTVQRHFGTAIDNSIYNPSSLIRAPYSINRKSGLYKIQLSNNELFGLDSVAIMELAKSNKIREVGKLIKGDYDWSEYVENAQIIKDPIEYKRNTVDNSINIMNCIQNMYNNGESKDNRHMHIMRIAGAYRNRGVPEKAVLTMLYAWNKTLQKSEIDRVVKDTFANGYNYGCNDHILARYCDSKCIYYKKKNLTSEIRNIEEIKDSLFLYTEKRLSGTFIDLKSVFNLQESYRIYDGELVVVYGDVKLGKSMVVQNIISRFTDRKVLLMSLENGSKLDTRRLLQISNGMTKDEVEEGILSNDEFLYDNIKHVKFYEGHVHIDQLEKTIATSDCDIIVIDTIDQLDTKFGIGNYTPHIQDIIARLRELTIKFNKTIVGVHHVNRESMSENDKGNKKKLTVHSGKGSSALEQKADKVIGIEGDQNGVSRTITSLAARDEAPFVTMLEFNKQTFRLEIPRGKNGTQVNEKDK